MFFIKKIGIYGGTFNPPHIGHLLLAENAACDLGLDRIIFMTGGNPPHKEKNSVIDKYDRLKMTELLIKGNNKFSLSDYEVKKNSPSYTAETLCELKKVYSGVELYFIIGLDSLYDIEGWYHPEIIFENAVIAVALREGYNLESVDAVIEKYKMKYNASIVKTNMPLIGISSSHIRRRIKNGESIRYMTTDAVAEYIREKGLYESD